MSIEYIAKKLDKKYVNGFKSLGNNPKPLTKKLYINSVLPNIESYYITEKADGLRCFLMITQSYIKYVTSNKTTYMDIPNNFKNEYIFDCELVNDIVYIFDVIIYSDQNVSNNTFVQRYTKLLEIQQQLNNHNITNIQVKKFTKLTIKTYQKDIMNLFNLYKASQKTSNIKKYRIDGLIFTNITANYNNTINLKWKPAEFLTIDFLAVYDPNSKYYILLNGIKQSMAIQFNIENYTNNPKLIEMIQTLPIDVKSDYIPVPFYNSLKPNIFMYSHCIDKEDLHGHIIELSLDKDLQWIFHRIRHDRDIELKNGTYYGNNYKVAETTLQTILNPLSIKDLVTSYSTLTKDLYFKKQDSDYKSVKKFNNYVKNLLIQQYKNMDIIIDLASGRGGDLQKYVNSGTKNLLFLEYDMDAIDETIDRKYNILPKSTGSCNLVVLQADLNTDYKKNIDMIQSNFDDLGIFSKQSFNLVPVPVIFCHFALHYLVANEKSAKNIIMFIAHYLQKNGIFIATIFDGQKVFNLLKQNKGRWTPSKKYMISYKNPKNKQPGVFSGFGHTIDVLLPLADKPYEEPLIDLFALDKIFKTYGIQRVEEHGFDKMLDTYMKENPGQHYDEDDKIWLGLYMSVTYKKIK